MVLKDGFDGGKGARAIGTFTFTEKRMLYICIGGNGDTNSGWNGGGIGYYSNGTQSSYGGGCSSISLKTGELINLVKSWQEDVIIVAGGGGASSGTYTQSNTLTITAKGGDGGLVGNDGQSHKVNENYSTGGSRRVYQSAVEQVVLVTLSQKEIEVLTEYLEAVAVVDYMVEAAVLGLMSISMEELLIIIQMVILVKVVVVILTTDMKIIGTTSSGAGGGCSYVSEHFNSKNISYSTGVRSGDGQITISVSR